MIRIAVVIPVFTKSFVPAIFSCPHRVVLAFVDIEHFASPLCFADIEHFTRTNGTTAVRVVHIANVFHFHHVLFADRFVSAFVENNARIIPVINNGIAHQFGALSPSAIVYISFSITGRHCLHQTYAVARFYILFPGCYVHPADKISVAFHHHIVGIIAHPGRNRHTDSGPFVTCSLSVTFHLDYAVVEPHFSFAKFCFPESGHCRDFIHYFSIDQQFCPHIVQITVAPAPEIQTA